MPRIFNDKRDPVKEAMGIRLREIQKEDPDALSKLILSLSPEEASEIQYDEEIWLRPNQWVDLSEDSPATITLLLAGRGLNY